jgi:hypothetical protein
MTRNEMDQHTIKPKDCTGLRPAQVQRLRRDGIEDWLNIGRGTTDNAEDFAGGRLALERLLRLVEQPNILDGDDRLVGEGLEKVNLPVGKASTPSSVNRNGPNRNAFA